MFHNKLLPYAVASQQPVISATVLSAGNLVSPRHKSYLCRWTLT